ncbi:MAG: dephospho-CoA kinase [Acidobacteria bacterium]|nr:MAG: dephospho-CoA kinase [Acidobacteriota bacterium]
MGYFGLTGGAASGKSTVARMFQDLGARIIDADRIGHEMLRSSSPAYAEILRQFGKEILDDSGEIDRSRLGRIVFRDPERLQQLNAIVHPRIIARVEDLAAQYHADDPGAVILVDAALIFEAGRGSHLRSRHWRVLRQGRGRLVLARATGRTAHGESRTFARRSRAAHRRPDAGGGEAQARRLSDRLLGEP